MGAKLELVNKVLANAALDAASQLEHATGVAHYLMENAPDNIPDQVIRETACDSATAVIGKLRPPGITGRLIVDRCRQITADKRPRIDE